MSNTLDAERVGGDLRSMDSGRFVDMSLYWWIDTPIYRYIGVSICRCVDISGQLPAPDSWIMEDLSIYRCRDMSIWGERGQRGETN